MIRKMAILLSSISAISMAKNPPVDCENIDKGIYNSSPFSYIILNDEVSILKNNVEVGNVNLIDVKLKSMLNSREILVLKTANVAAGKLYLFEFIDKEDLDGPDLYLKHDGVDIFKMFCKY